LAEKEQGIVDVVIFGNGAVRGNLWGVWGSGGERVAQGIADPPPLDMRLSLTDASTPAMNGASRDRAFSFYQLRQNASVP
jgi:hypothetical protein